MNRPPKLPMVARPLYVAVRQLEPGIVGCANFIRHLPEPLRWFVQPYASLIGRPGFQHLMLECVTVPRPMPVVAPGWQSVRPERAAYCIASNLALHRPAFALCVADQRTSAPDLAQAQVYAAAWRKRLPPEQSNGENRVFLVRRHAIAYREAAC